MLKWFLHRTIRAMETRFSYDATYLHELTDVSTGAMRRFMKAQMALRWHGPVPPAVWHCAGIAGALLEDCGPCVQIATDMAIGAGTKAETIAALLSGAPAPADAQLAFDYARSLLLGSDTLDGLREDVVKHWGDEGLVALTFAPMAARNYPVPARARRLGGDRREPGAESGMTDERLAIFEAQRSHLLGIAYRMLGEMGAAEDIAQEAWLRWNRAMGEEIVDPRAWLSAVTVRLSLDALRKARARRESYVGPWLPEPILPDDMRALAADAPAARAELASDLSLALLHVLERLSPEERAALILHDAFDCDYAAIAQMLERNEAACRKLVSRARERVKGARPQRTVSDEAHRALVASFLAAAASADTSAISQLLAKDVVLYSDGGGKAKAALRPIYGADRVMRFTLGIIRKLSPAGGIVPELVQINGVPGFLLRTADGLHSALTADLDGERICTLYLVRNPDKLRRIAISPSPGSSPFA